MTEQEVQEALEAGKLDDEYSDYLMNHTDAMIGNGDMLIESMESGHYDEGFIDWMLK